MTRTSFLSTLTMFAALLMLRKLVCRAGAFTSSNTVAWTFRHRYERPSLTFFSSSSIPSDDGMNSHGMDMDEESFYLERFQRRKQAWKELIERESQRRPPNPQLKPMQVITELLQGLRDPDQPRRHFGVHVLLRSSTTKWAHTMCQSIGAAAATDTAASTDPDNEDEEYTRTVEAALHRSLSRPGQQFAILMGVENADYVIDFPTDVLAFDDDECWLECRLRGGGVDGGGTENDELLVVLGWTLHRIDGAWRVHQLDWEDFRDAYRPGIGREEWERICG